jgi:hypothetical protein
MNICHGVKRTGTGDKVPLLGTGERVVGLGELIGLIEFRGKEDLGVGS